MSGNIHINLFKHSDGCHSVCQKQRKENLVLTEPIQRRHHSFCFPGRQHGHLPMNADIIWEKRSYRREERGGGRETGERGERTSHFTNQGSKSQGLQVPCPRPWHKYRAGIAMKKCLPFYAKSPNLQNANTSNIVFKCGNQHLHKALRSTKDSDILSLNPHHLHIIILIEQKGGPSLREMKGLDQAATSGATANQVGRLCLRPASQMGTA